jgi:hypothetical protein
MNDLTVIQTSQGLAVYLEEVLGADVVKRMGIAIGYDHRASASGALRSAQVRKPVILGMKGSELGHVGHQYGIGSSRYILGQTQIPLPAPTHPGNPARARLFRAAPILAPSLFTPDRILIVSFFLYRD